MNTTEVSALISKILVRTITEKGQTVPAITPNSTFLGGDLPIDSLDLAALVVELTIETGKDPFREGFVNFTSVAELAKLYTE